MKLKKYSVFCFVLAICMLGNIRNINAGGISASANPGSVRVGETFTATVSSNGVMVEGLNVSCSGCTLVSGISRQTLDSGESQTVTARLDSAGGGSVTFSGSGVDYNNDDVSIPVSASAYVSAKQDAPKPKPAPKPESRPSTSSQVQSKPVVEPEEDKRSKDNTLKSLSISEGELSPKFDKDKTSYKVNLPATIKSIKVSAKTNDAKANVSGDGEIKLSAGNNKIEIIVTSEYGTRNVYVIEAYVDEKPLIFTTYNDQKLGVVRNINGIDIPSNFKKTTVKLDGKEIPAWKNDKMKKTIVYLSDEKNNKSFYLFDDGKVISTFESKKILDREVYIIDIPKNQQQIDGLTFKKIKIGDVELYGWTYNNPELKNYQIIRVMDKDGVIRSYQYEKTENTLQLYANTAPVTQKTYNDVKNQLKNVKQSKNIWMGVAGFTSILAIASVAYIIYEKKKNIETH